MLDVRRAGGELVPVVTSSASSSEILLASRAGPSPKTRLVLALFAVYIIWGSTYLAMHVAVETLPPLLMGAMRFSLAGLILLGVARVRGTLATSTRKEWQRAGIVGVLMCVGGNGLVAIAQQDLDSGLTAVVCATMPLWLAVFSALAGRAPRAREWLGLFVGLAGVVVLVQGDGLTGAPGAAVMVVLSPISWGLGAFLMARWRLPAGFAGPGAQMFIGGLALAIVGVLRGERFDVAPSVASIGAVIYLLVFGSLVAFTAFSWLVAHARPAVASSYAYVNPGVAVLLGALLGHEAVGPELALALPLIILGVVLVVLSDRKKAR